ncbi:MAG: transposase, partial [Pseudomonas sp.]|nr:transposase [Pseudomonas sp.]
MNSTLSVKRECWYDSAKDDAGFVLSDTGTCSDGTNLEAGRFYRGLEEKLAIAQRARNKTQVKTIHAKIANRRKDALH